VKDYPRIQSLQYCCVATCLEAVLAVRGYKGFNQLDIAIELGLTVPTSHRLKYPNARLDDQPKMWGEHIHEPGTTIDEWLERHGVPLRYIFFDPDVVPFREHWMWVCEQLDSGADIIALYDYGMLKDQKPQTWGHAALISEAKDFTNEILVLLDPGNHWAKQEVTISGLLGAMQTLRGGFGVIEP
jgi:hypothetical protein